MDVAPATIARTAAQAAVRPVVLVPACNRTIGAHPFHVAGKKYIDAVRLARCQPLVVPSAELDEIDALLDIADGILLTGSQSNVHPSHFGEPVHDSSLPLDAQRDDWVLALIPRALARGRIALGACLNSTNTLLVGRLRRRKTNAARRASLEVTACQV